MRIYLTVPFAEKDRAKKAGAKWSPGYKKWYIENLENINPFMRWIDDRLKKPHGKKRG